MTEPQETARARDGAAVRFPPPLLALAGVLLGVLLERLWPIGLLGVELSDAVRRTVGWAIVAGAFLVLGLWPVVLFRRSGQSEIPWKPTTSIVERGPYRFTRNPMYLQMVLICIGLAILLETAWILLLTLAVAWALQRFAIRPEEAYLERKFGDSYRAYKRRVRRWL
jgi:protein-S-isoprenylcysteine O-methyltransferase Ste14